MRRGYLFRKCGRGSLHWESSHWRSWWKSRASEQRQQHLQRLRWGEAPSHIGGCAASLRLPWTCTRHRGASQLLGTIYLRLPHLTPGPTCVTSTWQTALLPVSSCEWWYPTACPYVWGPWPSLMPTAFPCHRPGHFHVHPLSPLSRLWNKNGRITILVEAGDEHFGVCHTILFLCMFKNFSDFLKCLHASVLWHTIKRSTVLVVLGHKK